MVTRKLPAPGLHPWRLARNSLRCGACRRHRAGRRRRIAAVAPTRTRWRRQSHRGPDPPISRRQVHVSPSATVRPDLRRERSRPVLVTAAERIRHGDVTDDERGRIALPRGSSVSTDDDRRLVRLRLPGTSADAVVAAGRRWSACSATGAFCRTASDCDSLAGQYGGDGQMEADLACTDAPRDCRSNARAVTMSTPRRLRCPRRRRHARTTDRRRYLTLVVRRSCSRPPNRRRRLDSERHVNLGSRPMPSADASATTVPLVGTPRRCSRLRAPTSASWRRHRVSQFEGVDSESTSGRRTRRSGSAALVRLLTAARTVATRHLLPMRLVSPDDGATTETVVRRTASGSSPTAPGSSRRSRPA